VRNEVHDIKKDQKITGNLHTLCVYCMLNYIDDFSEPQAWLIAWNSCSTARPGHCLKNSEGRHDDHKALAGPQIVPKSTSVIPKLWLIEVPIFESDQKQKAIKPNYLRVQPFSVMCIYRAYKTCLVVSTALKNMRVRQLGSWNSQFCWKVIIHSIKFHGSSQHHSTFLTQAWTAYWLNDSLGSRTTCFSAWAADSGSILMRPEISESIIKGRLVPGSTHGVAYPAW
jgi:hypothetical protein